MKRLMAIFLALGMLLGISGCGLLDKDKDEKYDVTIKIVSDYGGVYIFTPDINEMHVEIPYDGKERRFYVESYQLSKHPRYGDTWFAPHGHNGFQTGMTYCPPGGKNKTTDKKVKEIGEYCFTATTSIYGDENEYRFRAIYLYITVK